jgi:hypothetical protein
MEIVVRQMSGLGNQMFQYAAGLYYATRYKAGFRVLIDPAKDPASRGFPRPFQLAAFQVSARTTALHAESKTGDRGGGGATRGECAVVV